jgi:hypothetical protein
VVKHQVDVPSGGNYQSPINTALVEHIKRADEPLEKTLLAAPILPNTVQ